MADAHIGVDPHGSRRRSNRPSNRSSRRNRALAGRNAPPRSPLAIIAVLLTVALVIFVLAETVVLPRVQITRVIVETDLSVDRGELIAAAGLDKPLHFFELVPERIEASLEQLPEIRAARVERVFPDTVRISIERRRLVALALSDTAVGAELLAIDAHGVIFDRGPSLGNHDAPVIQGINISGNVVGQEFPERVIPVLESLHRLRMEEPALYGLVSELLVEPGPVGGVNVRLYLSGYRTPILAPSQFDEVLTRYAIVLVDLLQDGGPDAPNHEVDVRSGELIYRVREEHGGR